MCAVEKLTHHTGQYHLMQQKPGIRKMLDDWFGRFDNRFDKLGKSNECFSIFFKSLRRVKVKMINNQSLGGVGRRKMNQCQNNVQG